MSRLGCRFTLRKKSAAFRVFKAWGAQFEGDTGTVSMERTRLVSLCICTARVTAHGVVFRTRAAEAARAAGFCFSV